MWNIYLNFVVVNNVLTRSIPNNSFFQIYEAGAVQCLVIKSCFGLVLKYFNEANWINFLRRESLIVVLFLWVSCFR